MSSYATKWTKITKEEYFEIYSHFLLVYSSYTNPDGDDGLSFSPQMLTTWGDKEKELIKSVATKESRQQEKWDMEYFKAIEWEADDEQV